MALVSVIIPNFNHAPFLKERIDSVLNQTYKDFEIIILDDCSTDNSREIIESYRGNEKISKIIYNQENSGSTFKQWTKGISYSEGDWIWIAESDDWCSEFFLENLVNDLIKDSSIAFTYCQSYIYEENNTVRVNWQKVPFKLRIEKEQFFNEFMLKGNAVYNASMVIFNKKLYHKLDSKEYLKYKYSGDWVFWTDMSRMGDVIRSSEILNNYRKSHNLNVSSKIMRNGLNFYEDVNALIYFEKRDYGKTDRIIKNYYFDYKQLKKKIPENSRIIIENNFKKYLGVKDSLIWDLEYIKYKLVNKLHVLMK